jgi:hypothetical protein
MIVIRVMTVNAKIIKTEKKVSPPQGRRGYPLQFYASIEFIEAIDDWRTTRRPVLSRSEAIRRLVEQALSAGKGKR